MDFPFSPPSLDSGSSSTKKLQRRYAKKISDYDSPRPSSPWASSSSSSSSSPSSSSAPSLMDSTTSFRVTGLHSGEFQLICEHLGLSGGPDAFAISIEAWESGRLHASNRRKSSSDRLISSRPSSFTAINSDENPEFSVRSRGRGERHREDRRLLFEDVSTSYMDRKTGDLNLKVNSRLNNQRRTSSRELEVLDFHSSSTPHEKPLEDPNSVNIGSELMDLIECDIDNDKIDESKADTDVIKQHDGRLDIERISKNSDAGAVAAQLPLRPPPSMREKKLMPMLSTYELLKSFGPVHRDNKDDIDHSDMFDVDESPPDHSDAEERNILLEDSKEIVPEIKAMEHQEAFLKTQPMPVTKVLSRKASAMIVSRSEIIIHSWRKLDVLGSGSFGTVYEGLSEEGIYFAIKEVCVSPGDRKAQQCLEQLEQEIRFLSKFRHENIVRYLGSEKDSDKIYIFLELATKGSISSLIRKYHLYKSQIQLYTRQILMGLKYLHDQGIVHRDIKCANILVGIDGKVKVADFGLATQVSNLNELKSCKGSAYWMAPEVIQPTKTYSFPADIWSLGCTVLEMATRHTPFGDLEWHQALWKLAHGERPPIPDNLPEDAKDFIKRCLQVDPSMRPAADQLLQHTFVQNIILTPRNSFS